ncbi:hypothetical protein RB653_001269 [Dictyostelium firmibasis]|uniref:Uncharacterized protein n=1 Tax=Dictyostelium firmibasis TaxID=79012 RepID=A0AAN7UGE6_9MYCE
MFKYNFPNLIKNTIEKSPLNNTKVGDSIKLFSFGSGWSGQLGLGDKIFEQYTPKSIEFNNVKLSENDRIKTGSYHALLVKENNFYVWGQNNFGQLGLGNFIDQFKPIENKSLKEKIENVECGAFHTIISTNENKTYSFGWNSRIQCGHLNKLDKINQPKEIEILNGKKVNKISCGFDYSIISTVENGVYVFGMNDRGQCNGITTNNNNNNNLINPIKIKELDNINIKKISSGWGHTLLLTNDGELLSWGSNQHGQCGTGIKSLTSPITKINIPNNLKVLDISCGSCVSSAILSDNNVYIWGSSGDGKLGLGSNQKDDLLIPTLLNNLNNKNGFKQISFGSDHCVSLPINNNNNNNDDYNDGIFFGWGFGQHGCLGFGNSINQLKVYSIPEKNEFFKNNNLKILNMTSSLDTTFSLVSSIK